MYTLNKTLKVEKRSYGPTPSKLNWRRNSFPESFLLGAGETRELISFETSTSYLIDARVPSLSYFNAMSRYVNFVQWKLFQVRLKLKVIEHPLCNWIYLQTVFKEIGSDQTLGLNVPIYRMLSNLLKQNNVL